MNKVTEAISLESDLLLKLNPLSEAEIFEFMKNLRGGTYFNMGMYSSIPASKAYKSTMRIYKVIDLTAIVSGVDYENIGTTKDFRNATGEGPGKAWYDHMPGYEHKVGQKKSDPNSKYVLWDIKRGTGTCVRYYVVDIDTGAVTPVSKDDILNSDWLTQTEKNKLTPRPVVGIDLATGQAVENKTNWRTAAFEHIFWLNQAGKATQEYGVRFEEDLGLTEAFGDELFMDAHAGIRTDLDAILAGKFVESVKLKEASKVVKSVFSKDYYTVTFKDDPEGRLFTGTKKECEAFINRAKDSASYKAHGGMVLNNGAYINVVEELKETAEADIFMDAHAGVKTKLDDVLSGEVTEAKELNEANTTTIRCANAIYEDDDGYICNVGIYAGDASFEELTDILYAQGMMYVDVYDEYEKASPAPYTYKLGDVVDVFDTDDEVINDFAEENGLDPEDYKHVGFFEGKTIRNTNNLKESYRRIVSRGNTLVDNELFVDFD